MFEDITGMSREEILNKIKENGFFISNVNDPDEEMQLAAVEENFFSIRCIQNPTPSAQVEALKQHRYVIKYIKHPCKEAVELAGDLPICKDLTPNGPYHYYEPIYTTMDQIMEQLECYINPKVKFFKYKKLETAMNYLFKQDEWSFENGSRACMIDIRKIDFDKLNNPDKWYLGFFDYIGRTEFVHCDEVDWSYYLLPSLQGADYCPDGMADYLVFEYEGVLYLITILCFE